MLSATLMLVTIDGDAIASPMGALIDFENMPEQIADRSPHIVSP